MAKKANTSIATVEILPNELTEVAQKSGLELTEAQSIGSAFAPFMSKVNELTEQINQIPTENPTSEQSALARKLRLELVSNRGKNGLLEAHKTVKEASLVRGRLIDSYKNVVEDSSKIAEMRAEGIERHFENLERVRLDGIEASRLDRLTELGTEPKYGVNIRLMDDETFEGYFENEKLIIESVKRDEQERERLELERQIMIKERTNILVESGYSFNGEAFFMQGKICATLSTVSSLSKEDYIQMVSDANTLKEQLKAEQEKKDAELERLRRSEADKKELLLKRFNSRKIDLEKAGFQFVPETKMFSHAEYAHDNIPSSAIVNMEDKPWKEYLKSVVDAVEAYKKQRDLTDKLTFEAGKQLTGLGFELSEGGFSNSNLDWFIGMRHINGFRNETELNDWIAEQKLQHAKLTQAKIDAGKIKDKQEAERLETERKAALLKAPDQAQVTEFYKQFKDFKFPELKSDAGKAMGVKVNAAIAELKSLILKEAKNLL